MRLGLIVGVTLILSACSAETVERLPTFPDPAPNATARALVWVVVVTETGACVPNATVEVVQGQGLGRKVMQTDDCSYWDPDYNATLDDLIPGVALTLRASALGYTTAEKTVVPNSVAQMPVDFELARIE